MNREKDLLKNTIILGIGKFLPKFVAIITLPIVTAKLTKIEYGSFDLISTLVMLVLPIATLQIQSAAFRFLIDCRGSKEKSSQIISSIFVVTIPISILVSLIVAFLWKDIGLLNRLLFGLYLVADIFYCSISQITRGLSHNKLYSISSIIVSVVNCISVVIVLQIKNTGLSGAIFSLLLADTAAVIYLTVKINLFGYLKWNAVSLAKIKELVSYSWPMIPNNLSNWVLKLSDRLIITAVLGVEANAVYAIANKIPNLLTIAQSIFVMAWQENASIAVGDQDASEYYSKMFERTLRLMFGFTVVLIGFTPVIFTLLIQGDYSDAYVQMPILILGVFFYCMSSFQGGIYVAHKRTKSVGVTTTAAAVVNLLVDILLINVLGITAGSVSTLVAYFLLYVYRLIGVNKFQPMNFHIQKQILYMVILVAMLYISFLNNKYLNIINAFAGVISCVVVNRDIVLMLLKYIRKVNFNAGKQ